MTDDRQFVGWLPMHPASPHQLHSLQGSKGLLTLALIPLMDIKVILGPKETQTIQPVDAGLSNAM